MFLNLFLILLTLFTSPSLSGIPGGWTEIKNLQTVREPANFAANEISKKSPALLLHFVECIGAKQQVVAGINYDLTLKFSIPNSPNEKNRGLLRTVNFRAVVFRSLSGQYSLSEFQQIIPKEDRVFHKHKPKCIPGGLCDHEVDSSILKVADFATKEMGKKDNTEYKFVRVVKAQTQVVNGINFYLTLELVENGISRNYYVQIYEDLSHDKEHNLHLGKYGLLDNSGKQQTNFGGNNQNLFGGWKKLDMSDKKNQALINDASKFAFNKIRQEVEFNGQLINVENASQQIVAGKNLRFTLICLSSKGRSSFLVTVYVPPGRTEFQVTKYEQLLAEKAATY